MKTVKSIKYCTIKKDVARGKAFVDTGEILIDKRLAGLELFYVLVHEILHVQNPKWSEIKVEGHAKELSDVLWQQKFRRIDEE